MQYRKLGNTNIKVSAVCLGTMTWGVQNTEKEAHEQMDYAVTQGVNFFDTAELYPIPPSKETQGRTEIYVGNWLKKTKKRKDIILTSKVTGRSDITYLRNGKETRLNRKQIRYAIENSLKRLQVDHIDLYQVHWPDRNTNYFGKRGYVHDPKDKPVAILETLTALSKLVKEGKVRNIGLSNETAWGTMEWLRCARDNNLEKIVSIQNAYSLIMRGYEKGMAEISIREKVGLLAYSPLSMGVLSGKYLKGAKPKNARFTLFERNGERYNPPQAQKAIAEYIALAKKHHLDPVQMALSFVHSRQFTTSTIIGATTMKQLKADIDSINVKLPKEILDEIESIQTHLPNPIA